MNIRGQKKKGISAGAVILFALIIFLSAALGFVSFFVSRESSAEAGTMPAVAQDNAATGLIPDFSLLPAPTANAERRAQVDFNYNGRVFRYSDDLIEPTDHLVAETIHNRKINAPLSEKLRLVERCLNAGATHKDAVLYCFPLMEKTVDSIASAVNAPPVDSAIKFNPDRTPMFSISREKVGYELIEDRLYQNIYFSLRSSACPKITVIPKVLEPQVSSYDHIKTTHLRAKFTTEYAGSSDNRRHNIRLALSRINGTVIKPGEEFSFNTKVGQRTEKNGFKEATIILRGEYTEGIGGGVCQASTTVYNCALRADLSITSARNHSFVSSYVEPSFDAMVNSGSSDLKFKNEGSGNVFIRAHGTETTATVEIYGTALPYKIVTESVVTERGDVPPDTEIVDTEGKYIKTPLISGERIRVSYGHGLLKSEGYLMYYSNAGKLIKKRLIRKDTYSEAAGVIAIAP